MAWLDALRGLAALVVVFEHTLNVLLPEVRQTVSPWFDFGRYGVFVFFLVSGYVVPASLERRGSVREFWIGRVFRLYPLLMVAAAIALGLSFAKVSWGVPHQLIAQPWTSTLAHLTMLQDLLGVPNTLNVFWTLSYEMVFYLLVTAMFAAGVHRAGAGTALVFALGAVTLGVALPTGLLAAGRQMETVVGTALLVVCGLLAVMSARRGVRQCGIVAISVLALTLLIFNSRVGGVESLSIIATMFAGTAIYRMENGQLGRWPAIAAIALVPILSIAAGARLAIGWGTADGQATMVWGWPAAVAAAWLTFLLGMALRHRRMPRPLPWLGLISYSIYLLHPLPLQVIWRIVGDPAELPLLERLGWGAILITSVLTASALAYRIVELPAQRLGRRLVSRFGGPGPPVVRSRSGI